MPRAVDPPGRFLQADMDPDSKNLFIDPSAYRIGWFDWLELEMLKQCFLNMINGMLAIQWLPLIAQGVRQAISVAIQFAVCLTYWAMKVVENLTKIGKDQYGHFFVDIYAKFEIPLLISVFNAFGAVWWHLNWWQDPIGSMVAGWSALVQFIQGLVRWALLVIRNIFDVALPGFLELDMLRQTWATFTTRWFAIEWNLWTLLPNFKEAFQSTIQLGRGLIAWARKVIQNISGIDVGKAVEGFAIEQFNKCFSDFTERWWSINWDIWHLIPNFREALQSFVYLGRDLVAWGRQVVLNFTRIDLFHVFEGFAIAQLNACFSDFTDTWFSITNWLAPGALRTAIGAIATLLKDLVDWAITVVRNFTRIDMRQVFAAFALPQLRACFSDFGDTLATINWLSPGSGALMTFIGAVIKLFQDIGNWILTVISNIIDVAIGLPARIREMFSSVTTFINAVIEFFFGANGLATWQGALDFFAGIVGASPLAAITNVYNQLRDVLAALKLPDIPALGDWMGNLGSTIETIQETIRGITGGITDFIDTIKTTVWEMLTGIPGASAAQFEDWLARISGGITDFIDTIRQTVRDMLTGIGGASVGQFADWLASVFGQVSPGRLGLIDISQITSGLNPNLLNNPGFDTAASIGYEADWEWDPIVGHNKPGSAKAIGDGSLKVLVSNLVGVAPKQVISLGAWVRYANLNGGTIRVAARLYDSAFEITDNVTIGAVPVPVGSAEWAQLTDSYTVPDDSPAAWIALAFEVNVAAGTVWFDDAHMSKSGLLAQSLVGGLEDVIAGLEDVLAAARARIDSMVTDFQGLLDGIKGQVGGTVADAINTVNDMLNRIRNLNIDGLFDASKLFNLANIGQLAQDRISGLVSELQARLDLVTWQGFLNGMGGRVGATIADVIAQFDNLSATIAQGVQWIIDMLTGITNAATWQFQAWRDDLLSSNSTVFQNVQNNAQTAITNAQTALTNAGSALVSAQTALINAIDISRLPLSSFTRNNIPDLGTAITALINDGNGGVMTRRSTGNYSLPSNRGGVILSSFFDRVDSQTAGIGADAPSSTFGVYASGLYRCDICYKINPTISAIWNIAPVLFKNGAMYRVGADGISFNYLGVGVTVRSIKSSFEVRLVAGDYVQAGYQAANVTGTIDNVLTGEGNGFETYFTVSLVSADVA